MSAKGRTTREFLSVENVWEKVDKWAAQTGYRVVEQDDASKHFQRGPGLRYQGAAQMVRIEEAKDGYVLEAWISIRISRFTRLVTTSAYIAHVPDEIPIDSGGGAAVVTSARARKDVNMLLRSLGVKPPVD